RMLLGSTVEKLVRISETPTLVVKNRCRGSYRKAVLATDFSEGSRQALAAARRLLPDTPLTLFHAFETMLGASAQDHVRSARAEAETKAREFLPTAAEPARAEPAWRIDHGPPATMLADYVYTEQVE